MFAYNLNGKNKYYTLYSLLRGDILRGKIKAGDKLPSKRVFAEELGVSVVTVQLAYEQLLAEGYVRSRERSGYFVENLSGRTEEPQPRPPREYAEPERKEKKFKYDFVKGSAPAETFPFSVWTKLMRAVLADCGEHLLERVPSAGDYELKRAVSDYLYRARGIDANPANIVIGAGAEHLYGVIVQLIGRDKTYAVENPVYGKIASAYVMNGAKIAPVAVGKGGMDMDALAQSGAHAAHVSPAHQFPTGAVMPVSARSRLIEWAESSGGIIVEDDYDSEFRLEGKPLQSTYALHPEKVVYMNTFSKSLAPSMRMGYMVLPPELYARYERIYRGSANLVPLFEQKTLAAMLNGGYFERHIQRLKNYYRGLRGELLDRLGKLSSPCEVFDTGSGLHVAARFPTAANDEALKRAAEAAGARIKCLSDYLIAPYAGIERVAVLNYAGIARGTLKDFDMVF